MSLNLRFDVNNSAGPFVGNWDGGRFTFTVDSAANFDGATITIKYRPWANGSLTTISADLEDLTAPPLHAIVGEIAHCEIVIEITGATAQTNIPVYLVHMP